MDMNISSNRKVKRMFANILSIFLIVVVTFSGGWSPASAAFPGDNGKIAFMSNQDGNFEIYVMESDGSSQTNLTNDPAYDGAPSWSPDGSQIVFMSERDGNYEIYRMNADGTDPTRLTTDPSTDVFPSWSPDGSQIVFARYDLSIGNYNIWRMNSDGTGAIPLTDNPTEDTEPVWSPDGTKILFRSDRDGNMEIYVMNPDGTDQMNLSNHAAADGEADWSPDGSKIVFASTRDNLGALWVMNADGSSPAQLTDAVYGDGHPSWSPDGTKIVFKGYRDFNDEIYVMNADGTDVTRLTNNALPGNTLPEDWFPDWQPGSSISSPWLIAFPENDAVEGWEWPEGATITLTIDNAPGLSWSGVAHVTTWGDPRTYVRIEFGNEYDLKIGDQVILTDEFGTTTAHTVQNLSVSSVNMAEDTVTGTANPGTSLQVWAHEQAAPPVDVIAGEDGTWMADLTSVSDIVFNTGGRSQIVVEGNSTAVDWNAPPAPFIAVSLTINWISLTSFLPDTPVTLSVYEFAGASTPVAQLNRTTDSSGNVFIQPWEYNWDVEPGNYVVATDGVTTKDVVLEYITLDVFDPEHDLISGKALFGRKVDVGVGNADGERWLTVFADETTGIWTADFTTVGFDITADMWAGGHVNDEDGDVTAAHNSGPPSPHFTVFPEWEWFDGLDWTDGSIVTITVAGKPECETVKESWGAFFNGNFGAGCDLVVGDVVTFTDGVTTRTHTVQNLAVKSVNAKNDTIKGIADPGAEVYVWPHATGQQQLAITDADGIWKVSFAGIFDLVPGEAGRSEIRDEFGNATAVDWHVPNPYFTVFPEWEWFDGMDWADGSKVTISVAGKPECKVKKTSWGGFFNGSFGEGCDVMPGDTVTFKDGTTIRTHVVQNLSVAALDAEADTIAGTADPGTVVNVWPHATGQQLQVTADFAGKWQVDFTDVFDLVPGECGRSQINDAVGNATAVDWCVPWPPRIVIQITDDWFRAENFAPNTPLNFWIYSAQDGNLLLNSTTEPTDDGGTVTHWVGDELDLLPGNYVVVSDGIATKELLIEGFTFDVLDLTNGILQGTAPEPFGRAVWVGIGWQDQTEWTADVTTDETGTWLAQFEAPIPNNYWWVAAQIFDVDGDASEIRPSQRMLTTGNFYIAWSQNNPEEVLYLSWKGSGNLTNPWEHPNCQGDLEFFGNSWVTETDIFWASLAGWGTTGDWSQTDSTINIQSTSSGCPGSAGFPINTQYRFFEAQPDLIMIQRAFEFGDTSYAHDVRPFIPRLYPSDGFTQVLHPNASGDALVVEGTCDFGCIAESWDGSWFAIHNPATGLGMIVQRVSSSYTSALWLDDDDGSFTNATSFLLLQPDGGFTGTVMETEYLCFYDSATWTPSLTLPDGCQP